MSVYGIRSTTIDGDSLDPSSTDLIAQVGQLKVGERVPLGWRVLTGNAMTSQVGRIAYRYEIEDDKPDAREALDRIVREMLYGGGDDESLQRTINLCNDARGEFAIDRAEG